jgi:hypothetical protein
VKGAIVNEAKKLGLPIAGHEFAKLEAAATLRRLRDD